MNKFKKWLIENYGVETWGKFKENVKLNAEFKTVKSLFDDNIESCYVSAGFWWSDYGEFDYWDDIHNAWQKHLEDSK